MTMTTEDRTLLALGVIGIGLLLLNTGQRTAPAQPQTQALPQPPAAAGGCPACGTSPCSCAPGGG
jgi:hypothetical protein